ncbi:MAG: DNA-binding protein WhiA [Phascolarctobacterium sp.]|nr:DNA-binding protein WhiA [Phascolarctobacterium sp.]MBQ5348900.1 DNA-binding protein WhiA [Phascolarctobacterium sp.]MBQ5600724.1 DNA-binding protein WhiA [Phascolarctobacterium sp.]MBQ5673057.1 DNA-binding protein WhiA [Phascolarctobacterium sp.]MBQ6618116.1 DNA-binding protein WhiA [Phascolarctobacterium sp.]
MSFSNDVKNELSRLETNEVCCDKAEVLGVLRMSGAIVIRGMNIGIHFSTENAALARRVLQILKNNYQVQTEVVITRSRRLKKNNRYQVRVLPAPQVSIAMNELQLLSMESDLKNPLLNKQCCKRAFLRGAFLGGGSISRPSSDYHLEMVTGNEDFARSIIKVMHTFSMKAKLTDRKNDYIVYLKDGESITNFLRVIGAHNSMMELENVRVLKEMRNNVNRRVNCETANLGKVVKAAVRQVNCIKFIDEHMGLSELPQALQDTARLRLEYPDASLNELVEYSGGIGKSGINHRLKKLQEMAVGLGMEVEKA